jgi:hypothetical protein
LVPRWIWTAICLCLLSLGAWGIVEALRGPDLEAVQEAVAPYSTGSEGCVSHGTSELDNPWRGGVPEARRQAVYYASLVTPKKIRLDAYLDDSDRSVLILELWVCEK